MAIEVKKSESIMESFMFIPIIGWIASLIISPWTGGYSLIGCVGCGAIMVSFIYIDEPVQLEIE